MMEIALKDGRKEDAKYFAEILEKQQIYMTYGITMDKLDISNYTVMKKMQITL